MTVSMVVCKQCGYHNADGTDFCGSCGKFLEWDSQRVEQPARSAPPPPTEPTPTPEPPKPPLIQRIKEALGMKEPSSTVNNGRVGTQPTMPVATKRDGGGFPVQTSTEGVSGSALGAGEPGRTTPTATPPGGQPSRYKPGDVICGECGTGNIPSRRFCRRCGASLIEAPVVPIPWWHRILPTRAAPPAGARPDEVRRNVEGSRLGAAFKVFVKTLATLLVVVVALGLVLLPTARQVVSDRAIHFTRDVERYFLVGEYVPVHPRSARASSEALAHPARDLLDPNAGYWAADTTTDPQPVITLSFAQPTDLDYVELNSGAGTDFAKIGRPRDVLISYSPGGATENLTLKDDPKAVRYHLRGRQVSSMQLRVLNVYPTAESTVVAMSQLNFFALK